MNIQSDNINDYKNSRGRLIEGIRKAAAVVKPTYGPAGKNVLIQKDLYPGHGVYNDGKQIMDNIVLADQIEQMGVNVLREACDKQEKNSGDGRKTTVILTSAILDAGIEEKIAPSELKRSIDQTLSELSANLVSQSKEIKLSEVHAVATISSENPELGKIIGEAYEKIGREGIIEIEPSGLPGTFYEVTEGIRLRGAGWLGAYSSTEPDKAVYTNPKILVSKEKINTVDQLEPIFTELHKAGVHELVIYCEDIDMSVASRLALTHLQGGFKTLIIKAPTLWKDWLYEDICVLTGATAVDPKNGKTFKNLTKDDLGTCGKIITTKDESRLIGTKDATEHVKKLWEKGIENENMKLRASWLNTKVAILKLGANSESELSYIIKKAKDATHASYYALKEGVVEGAGQSLIKAAKSLQSDSVGAKILKSALSKPSEQILENKGMNEHGDLSNVIDPLIVVKSALTTAVSIAGAILTTGGVLTIPKVEKPQPPSGFLTR